MKTETTTQETTTQETTTVDENQITTQPDNNLNINDLIVMQDIIKVITKRGGFEPDDFIAVGQTYKKISAFLEQSTPPSESQVGESE